MANARSVVVITSSGALAPGLTPTVSAFSLDGTAQSVPWADVGDGAYEVRPTDAHEELGVVVVLEFPAGYLPRSKTWAIHRGDNVNQFWALDVRAPDGERWTGAAPVVGAFKWGTVDKLASAPALFAVPPSSAWLFASVPSVFDVANDASIRIDGPVGSLQPFWSGDTRPIVRPVAPVPVDGHTSPRAICEKAAECAALVSPVWAGAVELWQHAKGLPFSEKAINRSEAFNIEVRDDSDLQSWGVSGSYVGQFRMVVRLGTPVHSYNYERHTALRDDVKRLAHALENYAGYPAGTQALFYEPTTGTEKEATPEWWETELVFRVVFIGALEAPPLPPGP